MDGLSAWRQWRTWLRAVSSGEGSTVRTYTGNLLRFLAETDCKDPDQYTEDDCAAFLATFAPRGHAKHEYAKALRSFFGWCDERAIVLVNPTTALKIRKPRRVPPVVLTHDELVRLLVAAVFELGERAAWAMLLTYLLGLRRLEAAGLKWEHIRESPEGPVIEIRATKGADQRDPLPLEPLALECLARLLELPAAPQSARGEEFVLRIKAQTLTRWCHRAGMAAELPPSKIGAHRLRASIATHMLKGGVDVRAVQAVLGHLRLESTAWYLAAADPDEVRAALRRGQEIVRLAVGL